MKDRISAEERAAMAGLWLHEGPGALAGVIDGVLTVPMALPPDEREDAVAEALAVWMASVSGTLARCAG